MIRVRMRYSGLNAAIFAQQKVKANVKIFGRFRVRNARNKSLYWKMPRSLLINRRMNIAICVPFFCCSRVCECPPLQLSHGNRRSNAAYNNNTKQRIRLLLASMLLLLSLRISEYVFNKCKLMIWQSIRSWNLNIYSDCLRCRLWDFWHIVEVKTRKITCAMKNAFWWQRIDHLILIISFFSFFFKAPAIFVGVNKVGFSPLACRPVYKLTINTMAL